MLQIFTDRFNLADAQMRGSDPAGVTLRDLYGISHAIGRTWRLPATVLIVVLGLLCMARNAPSQFRRQFDLNGLIREQAKVFTTTAAFVKRQLRLVLPAAGSPRPADYALSPAEWIARNARASNGRFNEAKARRALVAQLGARWTGPEGAAPVVRVMFAAFSLHLVERRDEALALLGACSQALMDVGSGDAEGPAEPLALPAECLQEVDALIGELGRANGGRASLVTDRHAWTHTVLMSGCSTAARLKAGVLPPAQFAWLKLVGTGRFAYALHSLGFEDRSSVGPLPSPQASTGSGRRTRPLGAGEWWPGGASIRPEIRSGDQCALPVTIGGAVPRSHQDLPMWDPRFRRASSMTFDVPEGTTVQIFIGRRAPGADPEHTRNGPTAGPAPLREAPSSATDQGRRDRRACVRRFRGRSEHRVAPERSDDGK